MYFTAWNFVWALVGAFGTAAMHQHTGRDPRTGGLIGLAVGVKYEYSTLVHCSMRARSSSFSGVSFTPGSFASR